MITVESYFVFQVSLVYSIYSEKLKNSNQNQKFLDKGIESF